MTTEIKWKIEDGNDIAYYRNFFYDTMYGMKPNKESDQSLEELFGGKHVVTRHVNNTTSLEGKIKEVLEYLNGYKDFLFGITEINIHNYDNMVILEVIWKTTYYDRDH